MSYSFLDPANWPDGTAFNTTTTTPAAPAIDWSEDLVHKKVVRRLAREAGLTLDPKVKLTHVASAHEGANVNNKIENYFEHVLDFSYTYRPPCSYMKYDRYETRLSYNGQHAFTMDVKAVDKLADSLPGQLMREQNVQLLTVEYTRRHLAKDWKSLDLCGKKLYLTTMWHLRRELGQEYVGLTSDLGTDLSAGSLSLWMSMADTIYAAPGNYNGYTLGAQLTLLEALEQLQAHKIHDDHLSWIERNLFFLKIFL